MKNIMNELESDALNAYIVGKGEMENNEFYFDGNIFRYIPEDESSYGCDLMEYLRPNLPEDFGKV